MIHDPPRTVRVELIKPRRWWPKILLALFLLSVLLNLILLATSATSIVSGSSNTTETFVSGDPSSQDKLAILEMTGTIMPPFTERMLSTIDALIEDDQVKGVLLSIDSPGGLVADSHQIYTKLLKLKAKKPIYVAMKRLAASGGYYVAMGAGPEAKIFAEPTTWTGSIGVIIPRYDLSKLASDYGVKSAPLVTGPYKDSLSPFREMTADEETLWTEIMNDAFDRFKGVIDDGRGKLNADQVAALATGQIYTANQALKNGLVDQIGYEEDAIAALQADLKLPFAKVVRFQQPPTLLETLLSSQMKTEPTDPLQRFLEASTPRAMYFCGWQAGWAK